MLPLSRCSRLEARPRRRRIAWSNAARPEAERLEIGPKAGRNGGNFACRWTRCQRSYGFARTVWRSVVKPSLRERQVEQAVIERLAEELADEEQG